MQQYVKFKDKSADGNYIDAKNTDTIEFEYHPATSGRIELRKISENLTVLKLYFRKLSSLNKPINVFESSTEIMLTNYPVKFNSIEDLNNQTIEIKYGWTDGVLFTMISLQDGEPINDNILHFKLNSDKSITVNWEGSYTYYHHSNGSKFELSILAFVESDIVTPLCLYDDEVGEIFKHKKLEDFSKDPDID